MFVLNCVQVSWEIHVQNLSLNRVELYEAVDSKGASSRAHTQKKKRSYDLNPQDKFWQNHKGRFVLDPCACFSPCMGMPP